MEENNSEEHAIYTKEDRRKIATLENVGKCADCSGENTMYIVRFKVLESIYSPAIIIKCSICNSWKYGVEKEEELIDDEDNDNIYVLPERPAQDLCGFEW